MSDQYARQLLEKRVRESLTGQKTMSMPGVQKPQPFDPLNLQIQMAAVVPAALPAAYYLKNQTTDYLKTLDKLLHKELDSRQ